LQAFIDSPTAEGDVEVGQVITDAMFAELKEEMKGAGTPEGTLEEVERRWKEEYSKRNVISGFIKDKTIGSKRLASMPDRVTNTINTEGGGTKMRPTVVNCFDGEMGDLRAWWKEWKQFMFHTEISLVGAKSTKTPFQMLVPIKHAKYPAITPEEEKISIPLQTMALAIFDAALTHMMNTVGKSSWQRLRKELCASLNLKKDEQIISILSSQYGNSDIVFLQETSSAFAKKAQSSASLAKYEVMSPSMIHIPFWTARC